MCNTCVGVLQCADLTGIDMHAMRGDDLGFEQAEFLHVWHDRHPLFLARVFHLEGGLGNMDMQRHIEFLGEIHARADDLGVGGIRRVRRNGGDDERMTLPLFDELTRVCQRVVI